MLYWVNNYRTHYIGADYVVGLGNNVNKTLISKERDCHGLIQLTRCNLSLIVLLGSVSCVALVAFVSAC